MENLFEVCTFDSLEDAAQCIEGGLSYLQAEELAVRLFSSGQYFGVEIISLDPEDLEPIVWVRSGSEEFYK